MISIIIPIYNVADYLPQCLESIINQTFSELEIILVDDGSTDGCYEICERYKKKDSRIVVIHKENSGLVSARKTGIKAASGQYVAYVDGDDWIEPDMYERMYKKMSEQNVDIVMCGRYEDTGDAVRKVFHGISEGRYDKADLLQSVYPHMVAGEQFFEWGLFPGLWDKLFRKGCVEEFQLSVDERIAMGEDAACVYPCLLNVQSIYVMHECLYHYRQIRSSMVKKGNCSVTEREQFRVLYQSVNKKLTQYANIYDLREQWKKYMLFLMVPRADVLLDGISDLEYLFPFSSVKKGSRIILYGMGTYGQRLYRYIKETGFCDIVMAVDRNYMELRKQGVAVESPGNIGKCEYDAIIVANSFAGTRKEIYYDLAKKYDKDKVHVMDEKLIMSDMIQNRFGLI